MKICLGILLSTLSLQSAARAETARVEVPAIAEIMLAGAAPGATAGGNSAPLNSPKTVPIPLRAGMAITLQASGTVLHGNGRSMLSPNGGDTWTSLAQRGLSFMMGPQYGLVGVFIPQRIDASKTPPGLNFSGGAKDAAEINPLPQQVFFIGDGKTSAGTVKRFIVPEGATALYLGLHAATAGDRTGSYQATVVSTDIAGYFPQIADGAAWDTKILIVNPLSAGAPYRLEFFDDAGHPLSLQPESGDIEGTVPGGGSVEVSTGGASDNLRQGWGVLHGHPALSGVAVFRLRVPGRQDGEASVFLSEIGAALALPFDQRAGYVTGVAIGNPEAKQQTIALEFQDAAGTRVGRSTIALGPNAHTAFALGSAAAPAGSPTAGRGVMIVRAEAGKNVSVLGLRFNPTGTFTSVPVSTWQ